MDKQMYNEWKAPWYILIIFVERQYTDFEHMEFDRQNKVCHKIKNKFHKNYILICLRM